MKPTALEEHYRELELAPGATFEQVRSAYRILVKTWHPDRYLHDAVMKARAEERLRCINVAFEALQRALEQEAAAEKRRVETPSYPVTHEAPPHVRERPREQGLVSLRLTHLREGYGFLDHNGRMSIPGPFAYAEEFSEGLAVIGSSKIPSLSRYGYIDDSGRTAIPMQYDAATGFCEGRAAVRMRSAWGFIDNRGNYIVVPRFQMAQAFSEGFAAIKEAGAWGFIDRLGNYLFTPRFQMVKPFRDGWGMVAIGRRLAKVNASGEIVMYHERFSI